MEDSYKRKVNQNLLKHGLLALYNKKVTGGGPATKTRVT